MQIKKFNNIEEFMNSKEFEFKDLSYCNVSNLDLSKFAEITWENFKFFHTNFSNSNIQFKIENLKKNGKGESILEYCNFTGCNLSNIRLFNVSCIGSNFMNTNLKYNPPIICSNDKKRFKNVVFSNEISNFAHELAESGWLDFETISINSHLNFSSEEIYIAIRNELPSSNKFISTTKCEEALKIINKGLDEDEKRGGYLNKFYNSLDNGQFSNIDKVLFFQGIVQNKIFDQVDFSYVAYTLLAKFEFKNCEFNQITLPQDTMDVTGKYNLNFYKNKKIYSIFKNDGSEFTQDLSTYTKIPYIIIPKVTSSSWKDFKGRLQKDNKRFGFTCFTTETNLYLQLGKTCNASCIFGCRNQCLESSEYNRNTNTIINNFQTISPYINNVVVGGGEPTLYFEDLKYFKEKCNYNNIGYYVSTNGTCSFDKLEELQNKYTIYLSRHALEDRDNDNVFGTSTIKIEEIKDLEEPLILTATCYNGGLDTVEDLEKYIELSDYVNSKGILFQTLHKDLNFKEQRIPQIDDRIFDEVIFKLKEQGYSGGEIPIYSTGNYKLIRLTSPNNEKIIAFKKYITMEESKLEWNRAAKRTFDLSMEINGDIYENWNQTSEPILLSRKK